MDESTNHDARIVRESRDTVDVLLVFVSVQVLSPFYTDGVSGWSFLSGGDYVRITDIPEPAGGLWSGIGILTLRNGPHSARHREWFLSRQCPGFLTQSIHSIHSRDYRCLGERALVHEPLP